MIGGVRWWLKEGDGAIINLITGESPKLILHGIPEPGSLVLALLGCITLTTLARRRT